MLANMLVPIANRLKNMNLAGKEIGCNQLQKEEDSDIL